MVKVSASDILSFVERHGFLQALKSGLAIIHLKILRHLLPPSTFSYNGIKVANGRLFDDKFPWTKGNVPLYESALCDSLRQEVRSGDDIVVVGGGLGVTAAVAGKLTGPLGSVTVYEPDAGRYRKVLETAEMNDLEDRFTVHQCSVGGQVKIEAEVEDAEEISPTDLPECDVLEIDCEGAELRLLDNLTQRPRVIVVESHGYLGAPTEEVIARLQKLGYEIHNVQLAEERLDDFCRQRDIHCIRATRG